MERLILRRDHDIHLARSVAVLVYDFPLANIESTRQVVEQELA